jgi:hypothetical protein
MTVSSSASRISYAGNGSETIFAFPYYFLADADLVVVRRNDATGDETTLALDTDYAVTGAGMPAGGTITTTAPPAAGQTLTVRRVVSLTQSTDFVANDPLDAEVLERAVDRAIMADQQLQEQADRAIKFPVGDSTALSTTLPPATARASRNFGFNAAGEPIAVDPPVIDSAALIVVGGTTPAHQTGRLWVDTGTVGLLIVKQSDGADWTELWRVDATANAFRHQSDITVASADAGAGQGPTLTLDRASASPAAADLLGALAFQGRSATGVARGYARLLGDIVDATNASEDGRLLLQTAVGGTLATRAYLGAGVVVGAPTGGDPGAGKLNAEELQVGGVVVGGMPRSYLAGLGLANNATDATNDIDIAAGAARADDNTADMVLAAALTKRLDAGWAVGSNQGGLDNGSKAANTWYHVWLIKRPDTGVVDALFSTSASAPVLPANYTKKRRIGAARTDGSGSILGFVQRGDWVNWALPSRDISTTTQANVATTQTLLVPTGLRLVAIVALAISGPNSENSAALFPVDIPTPALDALVSGVVGNAGNGSSGVSNNPIHVLTSTSGQVKLVAGGNSPTTSKTINGSTWGWIDRRGRDD